MILFATGLTINSANLLYGIQSINQTLPVVGGNAGDNSLMKQSFVFGNKGITDCGVVGAILESQQLYVNRYWNLGWQPIGKEMTVTKADKLRVYSIDNMPAYKAYQTYLGFDDGGNFMNATEFPLLMNRHGITMARIPYISYEDGSLGFLAADIIEGEKVRFSYGHVGNMLDKIENLCREIIQEPAEGIFIYSCESRRGFLMENSGIETMPMQKLAPVAGFFTYGEFFHESGTNQLLNGAMTVLVLSESEKIESRHLEDSACDEAKQIKEIINHNNVTGKNLGVLKALTHLINKVTNEFVDANEKLKYLGLHDSLTGFYNRNYFEEEMKRCNIYEEPVGIIICDIDGLKLINDILGHSFGDGIICMAAECLAAACRPEDVIARIGGDEFAILVPDADKVRLVEICNRILSTAADYRDSKSNMFYTCLWGLL